MTDVCRRVLVAGRVQGVFFRDTCRRVACELGVSGWVRNLSDGRVEVVIAGAPAAVEQLVDWCRVGPPHAHVTGVEVTERLPLADTGFAVRS